MQSSVNEKIKLEYQKLITEYNALLIALASATIGFAALIYTLTKDNLLSLTGLIITFIIINSEKEDKSNQLGSKIKELD